MTGRAPTRGIAREPPLFAAGGGTSPLLALAALLLSILGALDLTASATVARALRAWPGRLAGSVTVAAQGRGVESADAAAARAAESLRLTPGLADVRVLDPAPADSLAGRLLGLAAPGPGTAEPPRLVTARFAGGSHPAAGALQGSLRQAGLNVAVDDHGPWSGPLERAALLATAAAAGVGLVALAAMAAVAARIAARRLRRQAGRAKLLVQLGATEAMLSGPVGRGATAAAALWAGVGAAAVAGTTALLTQTAPAANWVDAWLWSRGLPAPAPDGLDLAAALVWPVVVAPVAAWASGAAARSALRKLS